MIFQENVSFDHYFATYPKAANIPGETQQGSGTAAATFTAAKNTPKKHRHPGHRRPPGAEQPQLGAAARLTPAQAVTCDQDHSYSAEQKAYNGGAMDKFVEFTSRDACGTDRTAATGLTMDYYDGNTVTGIWNYAQHYAMSDNHFSTVFGPSTPGALNLVSGQTHGATEFTADGKPVATPAAGSYTVRLPDAQRRRHRHQRPGPGLRRLLQQQPRQDQQPGRHDAAGTSATCSTPRAVLGLVPGRLHADHRRDRRTRPASCLTSHTNVAGVSRGRLLPAPPAVPVLRVDGQPAPPGRRRPTRRSATTDRRTTSTT